MIRKQSDGVRLELVGAIAAPAAFAVMAGNVFDCAAATLGGWVAAGALAIVAPAARRRWK